MGKHGPTLADVARVAGVSRSTASNAYNRPDQLSAPVRDRVFAAATSLGYPGPDPLARQLRTGRSGTVGVLVLERPGYAFSDPAAQLFLDGLAEGLGDTATGLLLLWGGPEAGGPPPSAVRAAGVDGFVSYCLPGDTAALDAVQERGLPLVTIDGPVGRGEACVRVANRAGQAAAVRHLLDLGHRRFGVVSMPLRADGFVGLATVEQLLDVTDPSSRDRLAAVRDELDRAGIDPGAAPVAVARSSHRPTDASSPACCWASHHARPPWWPSPTGSPSAAWTPRGPSGCASRTICPSPASTRSPRRTRRSRRSPPWRRTTRSRAGSAVSCCARCSTGTHRATSR